MTDEVIAASAADRTVIREDLDFTTHFSEGYAVPEPVTLAESARDIDELGLIGVNALKDHGYFTRMVVEHRSLAPKLLNPQNIRVLIVDDDDATGKLIELTLHAAGCKTRRARNRQEIAQALAEKPLPHLVLLDILLPDVNGFDVLNRIRHHPALEKIPVMLLSALGERKDVTRGLALGADGYITKPVLPSVLLKAVEATIGG
jgi:two-component system OmpR family response regulator